MNAYWAGYFNRIGSSLSLYNVCISMSDEQIYTYSIHVYIRQRCNDTIGSPDNVGTVESISDRVDDHC